MNINISNVVEVLSKLKEADAEKKKAFLWLRLPTDDLRHTIIVYRVHEIKDGKIIGLMSIDGERAHVCEIALDDCEVPCSRFIYLKRAIETSRG